MRKILQGAAFLLFLVFLLAGVNLYFNKDQKNEANQHYSGFTHMNFTMYGKSYDLLVADTPQKQEKGLMFYRSLPGVDGMIFLFPDKDIRSFWNKNTYMDLDIYWVDGTNVVGKTELPSVEEKGVVIVNSDKKVDKVIEIPKK
jgi:uncharacterized membrane protein (UPF0127 family)